VHTGKSTTIKPETAATENPSFKDVNEDTMDAAVEDAHYVLRCDQKRSSDKRIYEKDPNFNGDCDYRCGRCWTPLLDPFELRGACSGCDQCTQ
jgi:predicted SprT family Zn-dependent metalloprotease